MANFTFFKRVALSGLLSFAANGHVAMAQDGPGIDLYALNPVERLGLVVAVLAPDDSSPPPEQAPERPEILVPVPTMPIEWWEDAAKRMFDIFDRDGNGDFTIGELRDIVAEYLGEEILKLVACEAENQATPERCDAIRKKIADYMKILEGIRIHPDEKSIFTWEQIQRYYRKLDRNRDGLLGPKELGLPEKVPMRIVLMKAAEDEQHLIWIAIGLHVWRENNIASGL